MLLRNKNEERLNNGNAMKKILALIAVLLWAPTANADVCASRLMPTFTSSQAAKLCSSLATGSTTTLGTTSAITGAVTLQVNGTPRWTMATNGQLQQDSSAGGSLVFNRAGTNVIMVPYVPTMAATPVAGTNQIIPGLNIVPTAAANTAAMLRETPVVGEQFVILNSGVNSVRIKSGGVATMNGVTAGGYVVLPALGRMTCQTTTASNNSCDLQALPTPAGP